MEEKNSPRSFVFIAGFHKPDQLKKSFTLQIVFERGR